MIQNIILLTINLFMELKIVNPNGCNVVIKNLLLVLLQGEVHLIKIWHTCDAFYKFYNLKF